MAPIETRNSKTGQAGLGLEPHPKTKGSREGADSDHPIGTTFRPTRLRRSAPMHCPVALEGDSGFCRSIWRFTPGPLV